MLPKRRAEQVFVDGDNLSPDGYNLEATGYNLQPVPTCKYYLQVVRHEKSPEGLLIRIMKVEILNLLDAIDWI